MPAKGDSLHRQNDRLFSGGRLLGTFPTHPIMRLMRPLPIILGFLFSPMALLAEDATNASPSLQSLVAKGSMGAAPATLAKLLSAGGLVMVPLAILSVITLALILVYLFTLRRGAVAGARFMNTAETLLGKGDLLGLLALSLIHI